MAITKRNIAKHNKKNGTQFSFGQPIKDNDPSEIPAANPVTEDKHSFSSGATSSENMRPYHLMNFDALIHGADRFGVGTVKHGDVNYQKCVKESSDGRVLVLDLAFARDRYNHLFNHTLRLKYDGQHSDDNIGAGIWGWSFITFVDSFGFDWQRILNPRYCHEVELAILKEYGQMLWVKTFDPNSKLEEVHKIFGGEKDKPTQAAKIL